MKLLKFIFGLVAIFAIITHIGCQSTASTSAKLYIQQEEYDKAIEQLQLEVAANPENTEAFYFLGYCYSRQNKFEEMNDAFDKSLAISNAHENEIKFERTKHWQNNFNRGVRKFQNNEFTEAIADFKTAMMIDPTQAGTYKNLAISYVRVEDNENATKSYKKALELDTSDVQLSINYGYHLYNTEDYQGTIDIMNKALELEPGNKDAIKYVALSYSMLGDSDKAMDSYNAALKDNPENPDLYFNRGLLHYKAESYEDAIVDFKKVTELNPEDGTAKMHLGTSYMYIGEKFQKERQELENNNGSASKINDLKSNEKANYELSKQYLEEASTIDVNNSNLWYNLGVVYVRLGMPKQGEAAFKKADELKQ